MEIQQLVMLAVQASILLTVFGFGLQATTGDVLYVVRAPACLARSLVAMFLVMPLAAVALVQAFEFRPSVEIALVALALSPVPPLLLKRESQAGGTASYGLGLMAVVSLLSIVLVPLAVELLGRYTSRSFGTAPTAVARIALTSVLLPLVAGMACRAALPSVAQGIARPVTLVATTLLSAGALAILAANLPAIVALIGDGTVLAMAVFVAAGLAVGHLLGG
ncbi:MAG: bile acid:sodium symporter family protein, partial [Vicinamibacterales bacterium]